MWIDRNSFSLRRIRNRIGVVLGYRRGRERPLAPPVELILEITNVCNLACVMCARPHMERSTGFMDMALFRSIIDQVKKDIELVYLAGGLGEPTIHPSLREMIAYCRDNDVRVGISTNATLLRPNVIDALLSDPPDLLLLSLDGATKETHEAIRVGSTFERTMKYAENFLLEKERRGLDKPYVIPQMVYMPLNQQEADAFVAKWSRFKAVDDVRLKKFIHFHGADYVPEGNGRDHEHLSCILPWRQISIAYDGTLALCCRDSDFKDPIGNARDTPIMELWNGAKLAEYRAKLAARRKSELALCRDCGTLRTTALTQLGSVLLDTYSIRKALPVFEKLVKRFGLRNFDYE